MVAAIFPTSPASRSKIVVSSGLRDFDNRILAAEKQGKSGAKPALCRNGECDRVSTSPNACLRLEPLSFEREGGAGPCVCEPLVLMNRGFSLEDSDTCGVSDRRLQDFIARVGPLDQAAQVEAWRRQDQLTKPPGTLGRLERLATQVAGIAADARPRLTRKVVIVVAGDHGWRRRRRLGLSI